MSGKAQRGARVFSDEVVNVARPGQVDELLVGHDDAALFVRYDGGNLPPSDQCTCERVLLEGLKINSAHSDLVVGLDDYPDSGSFLVPSRHGVRS